MPSAVNASTFPRLTCANARWVPASVARGRAMSRASVLTRGAYAPRLRAESATNGTVCATNGGAGRTSVRDPWPTGAAGVTLRMTLTTRPATTHHLPVDRRISLMGTDVRIVVGAPARPGVDPPGSAADAVEAFLRHYDATLSRFRPDSELSRLNADPREVVPASPLLRSALLAALEAAELTGGLVDPALLDGVEAAGYRASWEPRRRLGLRAALGEAGATRRAARPDPRFRWRLIVVDDEAGVVRRPPGLRIDTGGTGCGHAADLAADMLDGYAQWMVDCGGDLRDRRRRAGGAPDRDRPIRSAACPARRCTSRAARRRPPGCASASGAARRARSCTTSWTRRSAARSSRASSR